MTRAGAAGLLLLVLGAAGCRPGTTGPTLADRNRAPVAAASIPALTLVEGQVVLVEASPYFADPDGDSLSYEARTDAAAARVAVSGSLVTVTAVSSGRTILTLTARDPGGLAATQSTGVTVRPHQAPMAKGTNPSVNLASSDTDYVEVFSYFDDPDGGALSFQASSSNPRVALASVSGLTMSISGVAAGTTTLMLTARDPGGLTAAHEVAVTVVPGPTLGFREDFDSGLGAWGVEQADTMLSEGVLALTNIERGIAGRANRILEAPINFWEARVRLGRTQTDSVVASVIFATGHERYAWYALDVGSGVSVGGSDTNYRFYVLDRTRWPPENRWVVIEGTYGVSDAIRDGAGEFTEIAASLDDGELRAWAGETELFAVTLGDDHPTRLIAIGLWVFPLDGAEARTALFDWVEVSGTHTAGAATASAATDAPVAATEEPATRSAAVAAPARMLRLSGARPGAR
ncbi:MAG: hypothetical protein F4043_12860 [Gammaproteobacteria bacterium]|nr:hypothetical protein [Gammaproteobacteria bacterium]